MLEMFNLKKQYEGVRQELAHALYSNDASNRVIARLMYERDQAREALVNVQSSLGGSLGSSSAAAGPSQDTDMADADGAAPSSSSTVEAGPAIPEALSTTIDTTVAKLLAERRAKSKRKVLPEGYATAESIAAYTDGSSSSSSVVKLGSARTAQTGINTLDVSLDGSAVLVGGNDKNIEVYMHDAQGGEGQSIAQLKGHKKPLIAAQFIKKPAQVLPVGAEAAASAAGLPVGIVSASEDGVVKVWKLEGETYISDYDIALAKEAAAALTGISVHPSGEYVALCTSEGTMLVHSLAAGEEVLSMSAPAEEEADEAAGGYSYTTLQWHPDGQLVVLGTSSGIVRIWDVKTLKKAATLRPTPSTSPSSNGDSSAAAIKSLDFSENGYFLSLVLPGRVEVWDLRKLALAGSLELGGGVQPLAVKFDPSGSYLAVTGAGGKVGVYANKSWKLLFDGSAVAGEKEGEEAGDIKAVAWDSRSGKVITGGGDRALRVWQAASA
ncbi:WD40 repeat-like protein [Jaminaea rosea]|uniref:Pre-mRNA-processing factor 19 n=1 Tax=Jaminaea rosea TaxID=1569628 RepID=A0A316UJQ0_9BASI|nr:WD40 repeat-like protein [Jaminaea rosea]PWN25154.1 WD40 repeat-like protein [Jaminaea rosea]